jgi:hypothetical protein
MIFLCFTRLQVNRAAVTAVRVSKSLTTFFDQTLFFFTLMIISQSRGLYAALTLDENNVKETRELIKQYETRELKNE